MQRPNTLDELRLAAGNYERVRSLINVRVYPPEWGLGKKFISTGVRPPVDRCADVRSSKLAAIVPPGIDAQWNMPLERLSREAIERSVTESAPTRERVDLSESTSVEVLSSPSIYLATFTVSRGGPPQPIVSTELMAKVGEVPGLDAASMAHPVRKPWWCFW